MKKPLSAPQWELVQFLKKMGSVPANGINKKVSDALVKKGIGEYVNNVLQLTEKFKEANQ